MIKRRTKVWWECDHSHEHNTQKEAVVCNTEMRRTAQEQRAIRAYRLSENGRTLKEIGAMIGQERKPMTPLKQPHFLIQEGRVLVTGEYYKSPKWKEKQRKWREDALKT